MSMIPNFFGRRRSSVSSETASFAGTHVVCQETPTAHVFTAHVPGMRREELRVSVEDGTLLRISGERSRQQERRSNTSIFVESSSGRFSRVFRLPENARVDRLTAVVEGGVLTITIPKA